MLPVPVLFETPKCYLYSGNITQTSSNSFLIVQIHGPLKYAHLQLSSMQSSRMRDRYCLSLSFLCMCSFLLWMQYEKMPGLLTPANNRREKHEVLFRISPCACYRCHKSVFMCTACFFYFACDAQRSLHLLSCTARTVGFTTISLLFAIFLSRQGATLCSAVTQSEIYVPTLLQTQSALCLIRKKKHICVSCTSFLTRELRQHLTNLLPSTTIHCTTPGYTVR